MEIDWNDYEQVTNYLYSLKGRYKKQGLKNTTFLLNLIGNPEKNLKTIHVGGTKGKGSVAVMVASILQSSGYKVGISISPHLIDYIERISTNGRKISRKEILAQINEILPFLKKMFNLGYKPSFFEITTAIALKYFNEKNVDFAVVEVGIGGRFDATNVLSPKIAVITNTSIDHEHVLGNTLKKIAEDECAIIKEGCIAVTASNNKEAIEIYKKRCNSQKVPIFFVGNDIKYERLSWNLDGQKFNVNGILDDYNNLYIPLLGKHQVENAATAIGAIEGLIIKGENISREAIKNGLHKVKWRGRMEILKKSPLLILDGAHNVDSAIKLRNALLEILQLNYYRKIIFVIGIFKDKDIENIIKNLAFIGETIIATKAKNKRSTDARRIADVSKKYCKKVFIKEDVKEAVKLALSLANKKDIICVTGSLYVVAEAMKVEFN